jgi:hypothetical protein
MNPVDHVLVAVTHQFHQPGFGDADPAANTKNLNL